MPPSLMRRAGQAVALNAVANWFGMLGGMFSLIFIARLITPDQYGVFGMALLTIAIPVTVMTALGESIIQKRDLRPGHLNAVFAQNFLIALLAWGAIMLMSSWLATLFNAPALTPILQVFSLVLLLEAIMTVPATILQRELRYGALSLVDILGVTIATIVGITCALILRNEWALVFMEISRRAFRMVAFLYLTRWRPALEGAWSHSSDLAKFNSLNSLSKLVHTVRGMLPGAMIASGLSAADLGMYNIANRILDQSRSALVSPFSNIALPVVSQMQDDFEALRRAVEGGIRVVSLLAYPAYMGAAVIAPVAVPFVFGAQWEPAVPVIQIVLLIGLRAPTASFNTSILLGVGRPDRILQIAIANLVLITAAVFFLIPYGLIALAWGIFASQILSWLIAVFFVRATINFSFFQQVLAGWTSFIASVLMAGAVWYVQGLLPEDMTALVKLLILVGLGMAVYTIALLLLAPKLAAILGRVVTVIVKGRPKEAIAIVRKGLASV